jgi:hypothetical protein
MRSQKNTQVESPIGSPGCLGSRQRSRLASHVVGHRWVLGVLCLSGVALGAVLAAEPAAKPDAKSAVESAAAPKKADVLAGLAPLQKMVGEWRAVGQPRRGSAAGSWQEQRQVVWDHQGETPALLGQTSKSPPLYPRWSWSCLPGTDQPIVLTATAADGTERVFRGAVDDKKLVVETAADGPLVFRATLQWLSDDRFTLLWEQRQAQQTFYQRQAEVAYQRQGTRLAAKDGSGPECVVTGGLGTIAVMHAGKTYYVCCTGCQDAFNADPEGILAEYIARRTSSKSEPE